MNRRAVLLGILALSGGAAAACASVLDIPTRQVGASASCADGLGVRLLVDASGPTSEVSVPYFFGELDYLRQLNANGGIHGCQIQYEFEDYAYDATIATSIYSAWKAEANWSQVIAILGFGSPDSEALGPLVAVDKVPLISASYSGALASPAPQTIDESVPEEDVPSGDGGPFVYSSFPTSIPSPGYPYNFFAGTDYSTGIRIALFQITTAGAKRVAFFHCTDSTYCTDPLPAGRTYAVGTGANGVGLEIGPDLDVELTDDQSTYNAKVYQYFRQEVEQENLYPPYTAVDWIWAANTTDTVAYLAQALANLGASSAAAGDPPQVQARLAQIASSENIVVNNWGFDETLFALCQPEGGAPNPCVGRVYGIAPYAAYGDMTSSTEMAKVLALNTYWRQQDAKNPIVIGDAGTFGANISAFTNIRYVQGYTNGLLLSMAIDNLLQAGQAVTGPALKGALESLRNVSTGGLTSPLSFTPTDHRPQSTETIYTIAPEGGLVNQSSRTIALQPSWLGW